MTNYSMYQHYLQQTTNHLIKVLLLHLFCCLYPADTNQACLHIAYF
nr:MAG TPA: hypothetical protein [Crassvirales sp.]